MSKKIAFVGIDPSITSTAVCIESDGQEVFLNYSTASKMSGRMKDLETCTKFSLIKYDYPKDYSASELYKADSYDATAKLIVSDIERLVSGSDRVIVSIEGYSHSSEAGHLIDLVTLGTMIRRFVLLHLSAEAHILAPTQLKKFACVAAYNNLDVKKKVWRDPDGLAGGDFKKPDMLKAMAKHSPSCVLCESLGHDGLSDVLLLKSVPKPLDDLTDAWWCKEHSKSKGREVEEI